MVLRSKPHLRRHLKHCGHCGIFFLTEASNVDRNDLGCPFGCSKSHRRQEASRRSTAYYRTEEGRKKKRTLNQNRYRVVKLGEIEPDADEEADAAEAVEEEPIIEYVRMVTSLIEGRFVSFDEIQKMLNQKARQHSLTRRRRVDYIVQQLNKDPP